MDKKKEFESAEDRRHRSGEALVVKALARYFGPSPRENAGSSSGASLIFSSLKRYFERR